jgi:hypothetical protein
MNTKLSSKDLAYIAGFFDGEGSITIHHNCKPSPRGKSPNHTLQVSIGNTNPEVLYYLRNLFGGLLSIRHTTKPNHRNVAQWTIRTSQSLPFLEAIRPYVRMKREVIDIAIGFQRTKSMRGPRIIDERTLLWREEQRDKIRILNAHIWIP